MRLLLALCLLTQVVSCGRQEQAKSEPEALLRYDERPAQVLVTRRLAKGDVRQLAAEAFDAMFTVAERELVKAGHQGEALRLEAEWRGTYRGMALGLDGDVGDHAPLSEWVAKWYQKLEDLLGVQVMEFFHLRDVWVLNFTIPVVFDAASAKSSWCNDQLAKYPYDTCEAEYRRHFAGTRWEAGPDPFATDVLHHGFAGVVTYWVVWAACEAATYGTATALVCSGAGDLAEIAVEKWVAPKVSDRLYERANP